jgi:Terminase small subunit
LGLTPRQRAFAEKFVANGCNGEIAAISAGYSKTRARQAAHECLKNEEVQALIERRQTPVLTKLETANVDDAFVLNGICALISRIETYGLGGWQAAALTKCYELLGRYRELFTERLELCVDDKIIERLEAARRRQEPPELTQ